MTAENIEELESSNNDVMISDIQSFLRESLPVTAVAETENIRTPDDFHVRWLKDTIFLFKKICNIYRYYDTSFWLFC